MFTWLKKLFGFEAEVSKAANEAVKEVLVEEPPKATVGKVTEVKSDIPTKPKKTTTKKGPGKKSAPKKSASTDLDSMNKTQLLAEAKKRGVKANASLKKDEILERIKNG